MELVVYKYRNVLKPLPQTVLNLAETLEEELQQKQRKKSGR